MAQMGVMIAAQNAKAQQIAEAANAPIPPEPTPEQNPEPMLDPQQTGTSSVKTESTLTFTPESEWMKKVVEAYPPGNIYKPKEPASIDNSLSMNEPSVGLPKSKDKHRSPSPHPPKMEFFYGDPTRDTVWSAYLAKFERQANRCAWSEDKKLYRLFDCLSGTALEFANKCSGRDSYDTLVKELTQRFDLKDPPMAARHNLNSIKQNEDESIESFLQRVMTVATDGFELADKTLFQNVATEAFLKGCRHKDAAMVVLNESPKNIQAACQRIKNIVANKKAVYGSRVSFQERQFTLDEEKRVSRLEKSVEALLMRGSTPSPARQYGPRSQDPGYWPGQYNLDTRGRPTTRGNPFQGRTGYSPSPNRSNTYGRPPSPAFNYATPLNGASFNYGGQYPMNRQPFYPPGPTPPPQQFQANQGFVPNHDHYQRFPYPDYGSNRGQPRSPSPRYSQGVNGQRQGYSPNFSYPQGQGFYPNQKPGFNSQGNYKGYSQTNSQNYNGIVNRSKSPSDRSPGPKPPDNASHPAYSAAPDMQQPLNSKGLSK